MTHGARTTGHARDGRRRWDRRTPADLKALRKAIHEVASEEAPVTVRGVFYRMVSRGLVVKDQTRGYAAVQRQVLAMRREGLLPYTWIADGTRTTYRPSTWDGVGEVLDNAAKFYRRSLWTSQDVNLEIWVEKDAISGVIYPVTSEWDVPLMVARGFSSETFLWTVAQDIIESEKETCIYHLGDHDASGVLAAKRIGERLQDLVSDEDGPPISFKRLAVTADQIEAWDLPTRPGKPSPHSNGFTGPSVEVDAVNSETLRQLVRDAIKLHADEEALQVTREDEKSERDILLQIAERLGAAT
jgi:hypothetical protein